jgi:bifunctional UDP-N-acetylglucosamine pyrophosphorylase/glucosamine-1-phosphate N-acetyltransferase
MELTAVILAAGLGTRMKSRKAKVLHCAGGMTLIEHVVNASVKLTAPERIHVIVGHQAETVRQLLQARGVGFIDQREQKGTGHALMVAREKLATDRGLLLVLYGDCPLISTGTLAELVDRQASSDAAATVITTLLEDPTGYGRIIQDSNGRVQAIVEQNAATPEQLTVREINSGIYCFRAGMFWKHLEKLQPNNRAREYYLTDMVEVLNQAGCAVRSMRIEDASEVLGINNRIELAQVDRAFRDRKVRDLMLEGVTIERPETVTIDAQVCIGLDTVVEPFTQILGKTTIGEQCRIGACSILRDSQLADRVEVRPFTMIGTSRIQSDAEIGPYARLRMENEVESGAHVGNFVELKKTRLGGGSKAMHLAYLGDSTIGKETNIGAGTITCNYDGFKKHPTKIGDGAFVGSNATLVAPVEIGPGAYVGAGSVITDKVPPDALGLGRARQVIKEQWALMRRKQPK